MVVWIIRIIGEHWPILSNVLTVPATFFFTRWKTRRALMTNADRVAINKFIKWAPEFTSLEHFFKKTDLNGSFETGILYEFSSAIDGTLNNPLRTFHSEKLKSLLNVTFSHCRELQTLIATRTFPVKGTKEQSIRRQKYGDGVDDMETGTKLNELATKAFDSYTTFLREAKSELITFDSDKDGNQ